MEFLNTQEQINQTQPLLDLPSKFEDAMTNLNKMLSNANGVTLSNLLVYQPTKNELLDMKKSVYSFGDIRYIPPYYEKFLSGGGNFTNHNGLIQVNLCNKKFRRYYFNFIDKLFAYNEILNEDMIFQNPYLYYMFISDDRQCFNEQSIKNNQNGAQDRLNKIYSIRNKLRFFNNFSLAHLVSQDNEEMVGQSQSFNEVLGSVIQTYFNTLETIKDCGSWLKTNLINPIFDFLQKMANILGAVFKSFFDMIKQRGLALIDKMTDMFKFKIFADAEETMQKVRTACYTTVIVCMLGGLMLGIGILNTIFSKFSSKYDDPVVESEIEEYDIVELERDDGEAQTIKFQSGFTSFLADLFSFDLPTWKKVREYSTTLLSVSALAGLTYKGIRGIINLLPAVLRKSILEFFGDQATLNQDKLDEWLTKATALQQFSRNVKVMSHDSYYETLMWCMNNRPRLDGLDSSSKQIVVTMYASLSKLSQLLLGYRNGNGKRRQPYSIHIASAPGTCKTLLTNKLITDFSGLDVFYSRPIEPFWSGYVGQPVVILDEFLCAQDREERAIEYLKLISTDQMILPMPSVDDPSIGIKGTEAEPLIVASINNTKYDKTKETDSLALQRRRNVLIEVQVAPKFRKYGTPWKNNHENVGQLRMGDLTKDYPDILSTKEHLDFYIWPSNYQNNGKAQKKLNYTELVEFLKKDYQDFLRLGDLIDKQLKVDVKGMTNNEIIAEFTKLANPALDSVDNVKGIVKTIINFDAVAQTNNEIKDTSWWNKTKDYILPNKDTQNDDDASVEQNEEICVECICYPCMCSDGVDYGFELRPLVRSIEDDTWWIRAKKWFDRQDKWELFEKVTVICSFISGIVCLVWKINSFLFKDTAQSAMKIKNKARAYNNYQTHWKDIAQSKEVAKPYILFANVEIHGIGLFDRYALFYRHAFTDKNLIMTDHGTPMTLVCDKKTYNFNFNYNNVYDSPERDYLVYNFEGIKQLQQFPDIRKNIVSNYDLNNIDHDTQAMIRLHSDKHHIHNTTVSIVKNYRYSYGDGTIVIDYAFKYPIDSKNGDCGSILYIIDQSGQTKIAGLHVALSNKFRKSGYATILNRESLMNFSIAQSQSVTSKKNKSILNAYKMTTGLKSYQLKETDYKVIDEIQDKIDYSTELDDLCYYTKNLRIKNSCSHVKIKLDDEIIYDKPRNIIDLNTVKPNVKELKYINEEAGNYIQSRTKIKKSAICDELRWEPIKVLPVLHNEDPRSDGSSPIDRNTYMAMHKEKPTIKEALIKEVKKDMLHFWIENLPNSFPDRELTIEEAVFGVPGRLKGMDLSTCVGGTEYFAGFKKKDFVTEVNGEMIITDELRHRVATRRMEIESGLAQGKDFTYIGFLKDELTRISKIKKGKTRVIYCGSFIDNIIFRMVFGSLLIRINEWNVDGSSAIGMNQYSEDMQTIKDYMDQIDHNGYYAGDFQDYDLTHNKQVQKSSYGIFVSLTNVPTVRMKKFFIEHETECWIRAGRYKWKPVCMHFSGLFLTTIGNNFFNEFYWRLAFKELCPNHYFEDSVRLKLTGDDHIMTRLKDLDFSPLDIQKCFERYGLTYTSEIKDQELTNDPRPFEEITFLGSEPIYCEETKSYVGALSKKVIQESLCWTRNNNMTILEECESMCEFASMHGDDYYEYIFNSVNQALQNFGPNTVKRKNPSTIRRVVAKRTATSGTDFCHYAIACKEQSDECGVAQNMSDPEPMEVDELEPVIPTSGTSTGITNTITDSLFNYDNFELSDYGIAQSGLTKFTDDLQRESNDDYVMNGFSARTIEAETLSKEFALETETLRANGEWTMTQGQNTTIFEYDLPGDLIPDNDSILQSRVFHNSQYFRGDMEIRLLVNGNRFQQGMALFGFFPLPYTQAGVKQIMDFRRLQQLKPLPVTPSTSTSYHLKVPMRWVKSWIRTDGTEVPATVKMIVTVPLEAIGGDNNKITWSLFTKLNVDLKIPRLKNVQPLGLEISNAAEAFEEGEAQGNVNTTTNYSGITGDIVTEEKIGHGQVKATYDNDNPEICNGSVPVMIRPSGMSKSFGGQPVNQMQLHYDSNAHSVNIFGDDCMSAIQEICDREVVHSINDVDVNTATQGSLIWQAKLSIPFNEDGNIVGASEIITSTCNFIHFNPVFHFRAIKTQFHSFRVIFVVAFGYNAMPVFGNFGGCYTKVLDFGPEMEYQQVKVNYQAPTNSIRIINRVEKTTDNCMGTCGLYLLNDIIAPDTVAQKITLYTTFTLDDVEIDTPASLTMLSQDHVPNSVTFANNAVDGIAQTGEVLDPVDETKEETGQELVKGTTTTRAQVLDRSRRNPFIIRHIYQIYRRFKYYAKYSANSSFIIPVSPDDVFLKGAFRAWSGGIRYRFLMEENLLRGATNLEIVYTQTAGTVQGGNSSSRGVAGTSTYNAPEGTYTANISTGPGSRGTGGRTPIEVQSDAAGVLDVMVPFKQINNCLMTDQYNGFLFVTNSGPSPVIVYTSVADDFKVSGFIGMTMTHAHPITNVNDTVLCGGIKCKYVAP